MFKRSSEKWPAAARKVIAVIRMDGLGDSLLSLPALEYLREQEPKAKLIVVASPENATVFDDLGATVISANKNERRLADKLAAQLREMGCGTVISFTEKRLGADIAFESQAQVRVGFDPGLSQPLKALVQLIKYNRRVAWNNNPALPASMHEVERFFLLLNALGLETPAAIPPIRLMLNGGNCQFADYRVRSLDPDNKGIVGIQLMPRWKMSSSSQQGPESFLPLIAEICGQIKHPKLLMFAPDDRQWAEPFVKALENKLSAKIATLCTNDLRDYAAMMARLKVLITPDGGASHVAAAAGTSAVVIFPEKNSLHCLKRWAPWRVPSRLILKGEDGAESEKKLISEIIKACNELCL